MDLLRAVENCGIWASRDRKGAVNANRSLVVAAR
jgi:hypothetical protein